MNESLLAVAAIVALVVALPPVAAWLWTVCAAALEPPVPDADADLSAVAEPRHPRLEADVLADVRLALPYATDPRQYRALKRVEAALERRAG